MYEVHGAATKFPFPPTQNLLINSKGLKVDYRDRPAVLGAGNTPIAHKTFEGCFSHLFFIS